MDRKIIMSAALLGFLAIVLGAFGAHSLKKFLEISELTTFETAIKYQMYNALFLLFIGSTKEVLGKAKKFIFYTSIIGVLLFSGSLYLLALNRFLPFDFIPFGFITPIGGLLFLVSWFWLFVNFYKKKV